MTIPVRSSPTRRGLSAHSHTPQARKFTAQLGSRVSSHLGRLSVRQASITGKASNGIERPEPRRNAWSAFSSQTVASSSLPPMQGKIPTPPMDVASNRFGSRDAGRTILAAS
jgi:hypothetical protein